MDKRIDNSPEITAAFRQILSPQQAGPPREVQALRLIAYRAQAASADDAEEALTWIYRQASNAILALAKPSQADSDAVERVSILDVWQQAERNHRLYSDTGDRESDIRFLTMGLAGEAGEVANFVKKRWRDGDGHDEAIHKEIADVCAYAFMLANVMGLSPGDLIQIIAEKQQVFVAKMEARAALNSAPSNIKGGK